jgi:glycerol uptake facilitator-like aquaporin
MSLARRASAEGIGTMFLLVAIVGSGILAERLAAGNMAVALLANSLATGGALVALLLALGPISGARLNPAVTLADAWRHGIAWRDVPIYVAMQLFGAVVGVAVANAMFGLPPILVSHHARSGVGLWLGEFVATFGLLMVVWGTVRWREGMTPFAVAAYIVGAYWFTSSTSFANPAVTIARSLSDTFAGIRPVDIAPFVLAQLAGAACATTLFGRLSRVTEPEARAVVVPHGVEAVR